MTKPRLPTLFALALVFAASLSSAHAKNVVLVVTDDQGQDAGCYGNSVIKTPHLDALAADATRFRYAFATTASCSASRSVILSGLFNHRTAQFGHQHSYHHFRTYENLATLPALLARGGYRTARIGKFHVGPEEVYPFDVKLPGNARSPVAMAKACREFVSAPSEKPFFLFFCTSDPHRGGGRANELPEAPDRFGNKRAGQSYPGVEEVIYSPKDVIVPPFLPDTPACRAELAQYYQSVSRIDQGLGALVDILKRAGVWDSTLFLYISDHGIAFPGAKTTVYEPGLRSPCIVRSPRESKRGVVSNAMVSWVDLAPTILEFGGIPGPARPAFHGRSFLGVLGEANPSGWDEIYASHTFHEITMYYPMRVVRGRRYKLIWNIAHPLPYPFASDLWAAPTWQERYQKGPKTLYGKRTVESYIHRPAFELYDLESDPDEVKNLAGDEKHAKRLKELQAKLRAFQKRTEDPWALKWRYE